MADIHSDIYDMDDDSQLNKISMRKTVIERAMSEHHIPIDRTCPAEHVLLVRQLVAVLQLK